MRNFLKSCVIKSLMSMVLGLTLIPISYAATEAQLNIVPRSTLAVSLSPGVTSTVIYDVTANVPIQNVQVSPSSKEYNIPSYVTSSVTGDCVGATLASSGACSFTLSLVTAAGHTGKSFTLAPRVSGNAGGSNSIPTENNRITVTITNAPSTYTVTPSAGANGSISPSTTQTVNSGSNSPTFTATPISGYAVSSWTVDGSAYSACSTNTTCTLTNVSENHTIAVSFATVASLSVIEPSLMFVTTASGGTLSYRGTLTVKNTGGSTTGGTPIATLSSGSGFTQSGTTCDSVLASNATCTFTFTVTPPVTTSATVTISDGVGADGIVVEPTSAISVTAFSPPVNATNNAALMLVAGCSSTPEVLQVTNLSDETISEITGTASAANWTNSHNPTITNGCSGVSLVRVGDVCSLSVTPNGSAVSGDDGTITVSGINTNTIGIIAAVEAADSTTPITEFPTVGTAIPITYPSPQNETVFSADTSCNLVKIGSYTNQSSNIQWDPLGGSATSTTGTSTAGNLGQAQSILAIHTIGFLENSGATPAANYAAGLCTPSQLNENNVVNWYLPSVGSNSPGGAVDPSGMTTGGDELGLLLYYGVNSGDANDTAGYWSSTEFDSSQAIYELFSGGDESRFGEFKDDSNESVRCVRALTY